MDSASQYNVSEPTEELALQSFERVLGDEEARKVWDRACLAVGFHQPRNPLTRSQLRQVADYLSEQAGFVGVMGTSLQIRIETYITLSGSQHPLRNQNQGESHE